MQLHRVPLYSQKPLISPLEVLSHGVLGHNNLLPHGFQSVGSDQTRPDQTISTLAVLTAGHYQVHTGLSFLLATGENLSFFKLIAHIHIFMLSMKYLTSGQGIMLWTRKSRQKCSVLQDASFNADYVESFEVQAIQVAYI